MRVPSPARSARSFQPGTMAERQRDDADPGCGLAGARARVFPPYSRYPEDFIDLVSSVVRDPEVDPSEGFTVAEIAVALGLTDEARSIAAAALARTPEGKTSLRVGLRRLLEIYG